MPKNGMLGEQCAAEHLIKKGYEIIGKNVRSRYGEIDVIAKNDEFILFVEVKTRASDYLFRPSEAVTLQKQKKIIKTAQQYLIDNANELQPRFDVIEIVTVSKNDFRVLEIEHIEDAFGL